jgi:peptide/nickel transport system substrate-binding protein
MLLPHILPFCLLLSWEAAAAANFSQSPMLDSLVKRGKLPPVEQRLPDEPMVVHPVEHTGRYGGQLRVPSRAASEMYEMIYWLFEPLLRFASDGRTLEPNVAEAWDLAADGKSVTIHLRKGMRWSDGVKVTTRDVRFAYEDVILHPDLTPQVPAIFQVDGVSLNLEIIDDHTFRFQFDQPYGSFPIFLTHTIGGQSLLMPRHHLEKLHPKYVSKRRLQEQARAHGFAHWFQLFADRNYAARSHNARTPPDFPTLSAWQVVDSPAIGHVILHRNPYYWKVDPEGKQLPYIDRAHSVAVTSPEALNLTLISGKMDFATSAVHMDNTPLFLSGAERGGYDVHFWESNHGTWIGYYFNQTYPDPVLRQIFRDRRFRIAMSLAIDREKINEVLFFGKASPQQLTVSPYCSYYDSKFARSYADHDPQEAGRLLDEIGLPRDGPDPWRRRPDGEPLRILVEHTPARSTQIICEIVKQDWEKIGVQVDLRSIDGPLWHTRLVGNALQVAVTLDDVATDFGVLSTPLYGVFLWGPQWARWFESSGAYGEQPPDAIREAYAGWQQLRRAIGDEQRLALGRRLIEWQAQNLWGIGTVGRMLQPVIVSKRLKNVPRRGLSGYPWLATFHHHPEQFYLTGARSEERGRAK